MSASLRTCILLLALQAVGSEAKMSKSQQQILKPGGKVSTSSLLLRQVEQMAHSGTAPNGDAIQEIARIIDEELMPDLTAEHQAAVDTTAQKLQAFQTCNADVGQRNTNLAQTTQVQVESARSSMTTCRLGEKSLWETNQTTSSRCGQLGTFLHQLSDPPSLPGDRLRAGMVQYVEDLTLTKMCQGPNVRALNDDCTAAEAELATKKAQCDVTQATFESDFCTLRTAMVLSCDDRSSCFKTARGHYDTFVQDTTNTIDQRWKLELKTLTKIKCYTDVWLNNGDANTADASAFDHCNAQEVNTDSMNIDFGTPVAQAACDLTYVQHYPGSSGFVAHEYGAFTQFVGPMIACVGPAAGTPIGASALQHTAADAPAAAGTASSAPPAPSTRYHDAPAAAGTASSAPAPPPPRYHSALDEVDAELDAEGSMIEATNRKTVMRRAKGEQNEKAVAFQFNSAGDVARMKGFSMEDLSDMDVDVLFGLLKDGSNAKSVKAGLAKLILEQQAAV